MLVPPVLRRCAADRAPRTAPREGTRLRAGAPARGPERPPGGPLRRGGRSARPRRTRGTVSGGRARQRLFLTRSPRRSRRNPATCSGGQDLPWVPPRCDRLATPVTGYVAGAGGWVSAAMHAVSRRRI